MSLLNKTAQSPHGESRGSDFVRNSCSRYSIDSGRVMMCHFPAICFSIAPSCSEFSIRLEGIFAGKDRFCCWAKDMITAPRDQQFPTKSTATMKRSVDSLMATEEGESVVVDTPC